MKRRNLFLALLCTVFSVCVSFCLTACSGCDSCNEEAKPVVLGTPTVVIDERGVASWEEIDHAGGYLYKTGDEEIPTGERSVKLSDGQSIVVKAVGDGKNYADGEWSVEKTYTAPKVEPPVEPPVVQPEKLGVPTVVIGEDGVASWDEVDNADGYLYKTGDEEIPTGERSVKLSDGQSIVVKAVGDGKNYADGEWSVEKTYTAPKVEPPVEPPVVQPEKLGVPTVTIEKLTGVAIWTKVENASGYAYKINGGEEQRVSSSVLACQLQPDDEVTVRAIGDGKNYTDGDWSAAKRYEGIPNAVSFDFSGVITKVFTNAYTVAEANEAFTQACGDSAGFLSVSAAANVYAGSNTATGLLKFGSKTNNGSLAVKFIDGALRVVINCADYADGSGKGDGSKLSVNGNEQNTSVTRGDLVYDIERAETIIISATGRCLVYGVTVYFKVPVTLNKPLVSIDAYGVASWTLDERASGYTYSLNDGAPQKAEGNTVTLSDGDRISVTAVGDGINYVNSVSDECVYTLQRIDLEKPSVTVSRGIAFWEKDDNALYYLYKISGGEEQRTDGCEAALLDGQSIVVKAVGDGVYRDSDWSDAVTYNRPAQPEKLGAPLVSVGRDGTLAYVHNPQNGVHDPTGFRLLIGGAESTKTKLADGDSASVVALGDGIHFTDSDPSVLTYVAPKHAYSSPDGVSVQIEGESRGKVIVSWNAVAGASGYEYTVNGGVAAATDDVCVTIDLTTTGAELKGTFTFAVRAQGDGDFSLAADGDYSARYEGSDYCTAVEFRVQTGDEKVYSVGEILKVFAYFGGRLPDGEFTVSGAVFANTAYNDGVKITLKEGDKTFVLFNARVAEEYRSAGENALAGSVATAKGNLYIENALSGKNYGVINSTASLEPNAETAVRLAYAQLKAAVPAECVKEFELPKTVGYGVTLAGWTVKETDENAFLYDESGMIVERLDRDVTVVLIARLEYDGNLYEREISFVVKAKVKLATPKITIENGTGVASWQAVDNADYYMYVVYNEYGVWSSDGIIESGGERKVTLEKYYSLEVTACSNDNKNYIDSQADKKKYNYTEEATEPNGTPVTFNFANEKTSSSSPIAQPKAVFARNYDTASADFTVALDKVYLGNTDTGGSRKGNGFLKMGSANNSGSIKLTFVGKRVAGVKVKWQTWDSDGKDGATVNGTAINDVGKNDWSVTTLNFKSPADYLEIISKNRVFILEIVVYLQD